ncbi:MAG: hypothetical protein WCW56_01400 [Candidatus Paceibacterota bacterium]|jgi:hypothetical protein
MKKISKGWWGLAIVVAVIIFWFGVGQKMFVHWQQQRYIASVEVLKAEYKNDTYGGATPEETLQLFIKAFQAGDLELASKYFIIEKQAEYLDKMQNWVKLGKGEEIISTLSLATWSGDSKSNQDQMDVWGKNRESILSIFFIKNEFTKKWKLINM